MESSDQGQNDEPKPEEDVDFLIDNVHAQDTEGIKSLDGSRTSVLVEDAFGHLNKIIKLFTRNGLWLKIERVKL